MAHQLRAFAALVKDSSSFSTPMSSCLQPPHLYLSGVHHSLLASMALSLMYAHREIYTSIKTKENKKRAKASLWTQIVHILLKQAAKIKFTLSVMRSFKKNFNEFWTYRLEWCGRGFRMIKQDRLRVFCENPRETQWGHLSCWMLYLTEVSDVTDHNTQSLVSVNQYVEQVWESRRHRKEKWWL